MADLYYNRYRDYDSGTGRYIQADPIGLDGDANPYVYAGANPVNQVDPMGLEFFDFLDNTPEERALARKMRREYDSLPKEMRDSRLYVFAHGNKSQICDNRDGPCIGPNEFAKILEERSQWRPGQTIWLFACDTGMLDDGFAAKLAGKTQSIVWAPTALTWWSDGGMSGIHPLGGNRKSWYGTWQEWWNVGAMRKFLPR